MRFVLLTLAAALIMLGWYLPNRPQNPPGGAPGEKFSSLSFGAYRPWESPLTKRFPTAAEADTDMALLAHEATAVRTYAANEGQYDTAAIAERHNVKVWQGIWLSSNRADNETEIARGVALANKYPQTITRVVVGNEVLLRRDLPPAELIAYLDRVKHAIHQPVAYADVWNFWLDFPQVAKHVDIMLIHLLPYWEDTPTGINRAVTYVGEVYKRLHAAFPTTQIAIGETGWPSRGRERADAVPSRLNEAKFLRAFLTLSHAEHFDYNFIEAFDQIWKYHSEGIVGASWGIFTADRTTKIPVWGPIEEDPDWRQHAALSILFGLALAWLGLQTNCTPTPRQTAILSVSGMALGAALGYATAIITETLYDSNLILAGTVNFTAQAALAALAMLRLNGRLPPQPNRTAAETTQAVRALLTRARLPQLPAAFEDLCFLFAWSAAIMQLLLLFDPRYREFPLSTFAVPLLVTIARLAHGIPPATGGREEMLVSAALVIGAVGSLIQEGPLNTQSLIWNAAALTLAVPYACKCRNALKKEAVLF